MVLTIETLRRQVGDATMHPDLGDRTEFVDFLNEALGIWSSHPWAYLKGRAFAFDITAATTTVELDERVVAILSARLNETFPVDVLDANTFEMREDAPHYGGRRQWVTWRELESADPRNHGEYRPHLILASRHALEGRLRITADLAAGRVGPERERIDVPVRLEPAFIALVRAVARGRFDVDSGGIARAVEELYRSQHWMRFASMDGAMIPYEPLTDGPAAGVHGYDEDGPPPQRVRIIR